MRKILTVLFLLFISFSIHADKPKLAVMSIEDQSGKLTEKVLNSASTLLRMHLASSGEFIVIDESRQNKMLEDIIKEKKKESYKMCYDDKCQIPLGQALSADTILRSTVTELGGVFSLGVELVDLAKEAVTKAANAEFDGTEQGVGEAVKKIVNELTVKNAEETKKLREIEEQKKKQEQLEKEKKEKAERELKLMKEKEEQIAKKKLEEVRMLAYKKELKEAGSTRRALALTSFLSGLAFTGTGIGMFVYSAQLSDKWSESYDLYLGAKTEGDAVSYRNDVEEYRDKEKITKILGSIFTGLGAGLLITGIITWSVDSSKEKAVKKKYNISFSVDPFSKTAMLTLNY